MDSRTKVRRILERRSDGTIGFWTGAPHSQTAEIYLRKLGFASMEELYRHLGDDCRFMPADGSYRHPEGRPAFDPLLGKERDSLGQAGCFAECESLQEVEEYPWPDPDYLDFTWILERIRHRSDRAVLSGMWSPFFHVVADFFGMENYFAGMYTNPIIVEAVTDRVVSFYEEANDRFFEAAGDDVDTFFFGNDFGTQLDLFISPECFRRFVLPGFRRLIDVAKKHEKRVLLHSCGAIAKVIPVLIEAGTDGLHPLQAKAQGMDAETLSKRFRGDIAFVGGVDTQHLLIHATPSEVKDEVRRLRDLLGPNLVVSASHEAILPNVPLENVVAMSEAAAEGVC